MKTYLALLRGINVGGKNIIKMHDLKSCFENMGFSNVITYIQSGNIIFNTAEQNNHLLTQQIEKSLSERFNYQSKIALISYNEYEYIIKHLPEDFGKYTEIYKYDVVFLKEPSTPKEAIKYFSIREGVDNVYEGLYTLYFSRLIKEASKSYLHKIISHPVYQDMTIRNWNTT
ncbi:MAG: DUF1697 domain-containing protein, partial [Bacteroidales bacterium]|nr:DUF1697 domain-containing protein [Bacteroidales bacterium]